MALPEEAAPGSETSKARLIGIVALKDYAVANSFATIFATPDVSCDITPPWMGSGGITKN